MAEKVDQPTATTSFDFLIVGGGTAGNTVAGRLAEDNPDITIGILEAGPLHTRDIPAITTPARAFELRGSKYDWGYKATMVDREDYTRVEKPDTRGKVLGGSSALNYYTWVRGSKGTYDEWAEGFGGEEWNWENTYHYFNKSGHYHDESHRYKPDLAKIGRHGPLDIEISDLEPELSGFRDNLEKAWQSKGERLTDNVYDGEQLGLVKCMNTIHKGVRSTSVAFLDGKPNITVIADFHVKKLLLKDGTTAYGAEGENNLGGTVQYTAKKEVILAAGVFEDPKILMWSGIGHSEHLSAFGIETVVDSKHVGQNLLDHPIMPHVIRLKDGVGLDHHLLYDGPDKQRALEAYAKERKGPFHSGLLELVGFPRIDARLEKYESYRKAKEANGGLDPFGPRNQPHFEVDFVPAFADAFQWHFPHPPEGNWLTIIVDLLRPVSKPGEVKLQSKDWRKQPYINLNFCGDDLDILALREGVRHIDDIILNGDGMKDLVGEDYPFPMPRDDDAKMDRQILERLQTGFHPCGTARLSKDIGQGVVDPHLKVHGVKNLRVIDASVFPIIPDCRIQNPVYMVAEKGADLIKAEYPDLFGRAGGVKEEGEHDSASVGQKLRDPVLG
ncbi:glucose-methanol-choline oxidoreductase-like protein [Teratosphaeria nubilosa]|uniref:Glucose-methanol-choline oxidoreductase-like protein n=1 Tax=Teratosphaeria nubilosa TaxID=161662 RepID=A0A6G1LGB6_9PEZI|nr:glucose-methanol-choline oxidoreductase-like protein [Teratosphaeria nubilosa]